ncbi:exosortase family protein XrtF [Mangrovimonas xylaniphaga]|uniref:exosortase family protein XrtF n=1 Tax=Mangrovimonas xylaniphaga TaxID=1645915 RepID=UPI0006B69ACC|nr:exosortase family protein XrtF [Mangrovimonas xylaniphaga]
MKELLLKYKDVVRFIVTFLAVYAVLVIGYRMYLQYSTGDSYYPDYITNLVARQSREVVENFGYNAKIEPHPDEPCMKMIVNDVFLARIVEGCNAISVIILFVSFIVAFAGRLKPTIIYLLVGSILIYAVNVIRIALLAVGLYHYPESQEVLHSVVFPLIIYGMLFLLWIIWVNRVSVSKKENEESN